MVSSSKARPFWTEFSSPSTNALKDFQFVEALIISIGVVGKELIGKKFNLTRDFKNIVLGISASGPTKRWSIVNYINLAVKLNKIQNCKFIIAASKNDQEIIDKIKKSEIGENCLSLENLSIQEILPIIKNCDLYTGNDTSFMHISSALGIKCIGIFVDSPAYSYSGYSDNIETIVPEGETVESTTHDTLGKDRISFEEVFRKAKIFLD